MNRHAGKRLTATLTLAATAALAGCAAGGRLSTGPLYRCDQGMSFSVEFVDDTAVLKGARGNDVLLRDAGGQGAQTVYSNPRMRAEFGLGASGREAMLHYPPQPLAVRCLRD
jgi:hypothetical protein